MGDRANILVRDGSDPGVYLYTHNEGYRLPAILQKALKRGEGRWNDDPYLARIIFSEMIRGDIDGTTGFGISAYLTDGRERVLVVDTASRTVTMLVQYSPDKKEWSWTFQEFVEESFDEEWKHG